jgi:hypothetical protein
MYKNVTSVVKIVELGSVIPIHNGVITVVYGRLFNVLTKEVLCLNEVWELL